MLGHDFTAFYSAGHFAAIGQFDKLYDVQAIKDYEQETGRRAGLSLGDSYGPYWNPPFYAWVFAPLSALPYGQALFVWTLVNLACAGAACILLCRMLAPPGVSLREAGIEFWSVPQEFPAGAGKVIYVIFPDPDGTLLELIEFEG